MSGLIIGTQEKLIHDRKKALVYPGSTLTTEQDKLKEYDIKQQAVKEKALNAPIPNIGMPDSSVLLRAVPLLQEATKSGIITMDYDNFNDALISEMSKLTYLVEFIQEVLVVGDTVAEHYPSIKPGMKVRFDEGRFIKGRAAGHGDNELYYDIPVVKIDGYTYLMISASDIMYYLK